MTRVFADSVRLVVVALALLLVGCGGDDDAGLRPAPTATQVPTPTATTPVVPATSTATPVPPTATATVVPTATATEVPTSTATPVLPTNTATAVPPTPTPTSTPVPATATATVAPTATATEVPTQTTTATTVPPTSTATPVPPTNTATAIPPTPPPTLGTTNVRALHTSSSLQYDPNCLKCHADVVTEQSLNPQIPGAHPAMLPMFGGAANTACTFCHKAMDFDGRSAANARRNVDVRTCATCHTAGPGNQFYQSTR